jgi:hypothetical protein
MIDASMFDKKEFENNMNQGKDHLHLLKLQYLAAQLVEHELQEKFNEAHNKVLQDNEFFVVNTDTRLSQKIGDRITDQEYEFCMSDEDLKKYFALCTIETTKRGLTKDDGTYNDNCNGIEIKFKAENALVDYQISLLPKALQDEFQAVKKDYVLKHKFIDIIMKGA